jgi:hypothetical protein
LFFLLIKTVFLQSIDLYNFVTYECFQLLTTHYYCITHCYLIYRLKYFFVCPKPYWLFSFQYLNWNSSYILKELEIAQEECSLVWLVWIQIWIQPHQYAFHCSSVINIHMSSETQLPLFVCVPILKVFSVNRSLPILYLLKSEPCSLEVCRWHLPMSFALYMRSGHCNNEFALNSPP